MAENNTYSLVSIQGTIVGPGGNFDIGAGVGVAKEGISHEFIEDKGRMDVGADGKIMHSLRGSKAGRITLRVLKTSPINAQLSALYNFQSGDPSRWGQNIIQYSDTVRGDQITGTSMAFIRHTGTTYAEDGNMNEWAFQGNTDVLLGTGQPVA